VTARVLTTRRLAAGFTLIELLVAMTVLGILMSVAFGALRTGSRSLAAGVARADLSEDMRATSDFLRRQFAQLSPATWQDGNQERIAFVGNSEYVRFVAPAPAASPRGGLLVISLSNARQGETHEVWVGVAPYDPGAEMWQDRKLITRTRLASELTAASISYFGAHAEHDAPGWHDEWRENAFRYPEAVRLVTQADDASQSTTEYLFRVVSGHSL